MTKKTGSKQEDLIFDAVKLFYPNEILRNYRPDFLKNKRTGNNLEIDIFLPMDNVGFEYQGAVHFQDLKRYKNDSDKSRHHDLLKYDYLERRFDRTSIVEIFECDLVGDVVKNISQRILNTQKYYFYKRYFNKCAKIEVVYAHSVGMYDTPEFKRTKEWFHSCNNLLKNKRDKNILIADLYRIRDSGDFLNKDIRFRRLSVTPVMKLMHLTSHNKQFRKERNIKRNQKELERQWGAMKQEKISNKNHNRNKILTNAKT